MRLFKIWLVLMGWVLFLVMIGVVASHSETMVASYYGAESGSHTASGARFNPRGMTAAHRTLPFGTRLRVCRGACCVHVTVNDRGPAKWTHRDLDLAEGPGLAIGLGGPGHGPVEVTRE